MEKIILALDLSSKSTGYSIYKDGQIIKYGCITSSSTILLKRLSIMKEEIGKLIQEYKITHIIAEDVPGGNIGNSHTQVVLLWLQGIISLLAYEINTKINFEYLQSSSWRKRIGIKTGRGIKRSELKDADMNYVKTKYGIEANDDICDSICLLDAYLHPEEKNEINWD